MPRRIRLGHFLALSVSALTKHPFLIHQGQAAADGTAKAAVAIIEHDAADAGGHARGLTRTPCELSTG